MFFVRDFWSLDKNPSKLKSYKPVTYMQAQLYNLVEVCWSLLFGISCLLFDISYLECHSLSIQRVWVQNKKQELEYITYIFGEEEYDIVLINGGSRRQNSGTRDISERWTTCQILYLSWFVIGKVYKLRQTRSQNCDTENNTRCGRNHHGWVQSMGVEGGHLFACFLQFYSCQTM